MTIEATTTALPRYDIYRAIHKALRHEMFETLLQIGRCDLEDEDELKRAVARIGRLLDFLHGHAVHESEHIHTAIEAREPGATAQIATQHDDMEESIELLQLQCRQLLSAPATGRARIAHPLYLQLSLFIADNLHHMHLEERYHNGWLWAAYSDAEIARIEQTIIEDLSPEEKVLSLQWMAAGTNPGELSEILEGMRTTLPAAAFGDILAGIRDQLGERRSTRLMARLSPTPLRWDEAASGMNS